MDTYHVNCPKCFAAQSKDYYNCGLCGAEIKKQGFISKLKQIPLSEVRDISIIILVFLVIAQLFFPSPYNPRYLFKRAFYNPTFQCADGIYSFAVNSQGACSHHGGIKRRVK